MAQSLSSLRQTCAQATVVVDAHIVACALDFGNLSPEMIQRKRRLTRENTLGKVVIETAIHE